MMSPSGKGTLPAAPEPYPEEAPSSWICRVAHAHDLSEAELVLHFSSSASELDLGYGDEVLAYVAANSQVREWPSSAAVVEGLREVGLVPAKPARLAAEEWWAYCPTCIGTGIPFIRAEWCHPYAFVCLEHALYLQAWPRNGEVQYASGRLVIQWPKNDALSRIPASTHDLIFGRLLLSPAKATWESYARAVLDIADGLATRTGPNGVWPPLLQEYVGLSRSGQHAGSVRPPSRWLWLQPAHTRLAVLKKMSHLFQNPDLVSDEAPGWLREIARRQGETNQRRLRGAAADELMLVAARLNRVALDELSQRAGEWPAELRQRWGAAVVVAALARMA